MGRKKGEKSFGKNQCKEKKGTKNDRIETSGKKGPKKNVIGYFLRFLKEIFRQKWSKHTSKQCKVSIGHTVRTSS